MATTPILDLPYLDLADAPDIAGNLQALAEALEAVLGSRIQHGTFEVAGTGANFATQAMTFPVPFPATPQVIANYGTSPLGSLQFYAYASGATASGVNLSVATVNSADTFSDARTVHWIALNLK